MISGRVKGQAELRHVQGLITTSPQVMQAQMAAGMRVEIRKVQPEVKVEAGATLPQRGGYARVMAAAVKAATSVRQAGNRISASADVSAKGRREDRDVATVNRGGLRHPLYGNRRHWFTTRVRPGFVTRVIDRTRDRIVDVVKDARDDAANRIVRG